MQATIYKERTQEQRDRLDLYLYGPPTEDEWMADPTALNSQLPADAMSGEAP